MITQKQLKELLPVACEWAEEQEHIITRYGVPLSPVQITDAVTIGVEHPEKVRLLKVTRIPVPVHRGLCTAADVKQLFSPFGGGLTVRYGIFILAECWGDRRLVCHELVHTAQYEKLGGIQQFLQQYLYECITVGYPAAPMEQEAVQTTEKVCSSETRKESGGRP
jgi:hypothetical protein